jgi:enoyl-CoA hydratase/carnithine racemase
VCGVWYEYKNQKSESARVAITSEMRRLIPSRAAVGRLGAGSRVRWLGTAPRSAPAFEEISLACTGRRATLTLDRPGALNALTERSMREVIAAAAWIDAQPDVRVVVVRGAGRAFCAGFDLAAAPPEQGGLGELGHEMACALERMSAVSIGALHGAVVGGGVVLATACDLRVAAHGTTFAIPEVDLGVPLAWGGVHRLMRELRPSAVKELIMTCRRFDAAEACELGLLNRVVPHAELDDAVDQLAEAIALRPRQAVLLTKARVDEIASRMVDLQSADADASMLAEALADREGADARARYLERLRARES